MGNNTQTVDTVTVTADTFNKILAVLGAVPYAQVASLMHEIRSTAQPGQQLDAAVPDSGGSEVE